MQVTETLDMQKDQKAMLQKDWIITQSQDPAIREIKYLISKNKLMEHKVYLQDPQTLKQYLQQHSHLMPWKGVLYRWVTPSNEDRNAIQSPRDIKRKLCKGVIITSGIWG